MVSCPAQVAWNYHGDKMITNWTFSFWPPIPAQNNRDLAKDTRYVDLRAFNMLHGLKPFHVTCVLLTSNVSTFGHCPVWSLGFADREPSADSCRKRIDADKLYRQNVVRSPASTWTSTTLEITRGLPRRAMVETHSTVSHWHTAGLGSQVLNRTQYASHKVSVSECLCEKCATHVLICSFHCVWRRIGQMTRRSTPERSRARVKSDSSQRYRRRSQDRRESRELGNTQKWHGARMGLFQRDTQNRTNILSQCMCIGWNVRRNEKNVRVRAYGEVLSVQLIVAFTTFANVWTRNFFKKTTSWLVNVQDCKEIWELKATWGTVETTFRSSFLELIEHESSLVFAFLSSDHFWSWHSSVCHSLPLDVVL